MRVGAQVQESDRRFLSSGKGLGRAENGISEAIKVKVKCDKGGVSAVRLYAADACVDAKTERAIYISSARLAIKKGSSSPSTGGIMSSIKPPPACRWSLIK